MRTRAFVILTVLLTVLAGVRLGRWALAGPTAIALPVTTTTPTTAPAFLTGPIVRLHPVSVVGVTAGAPTAPAPGRAWTWDALAWCESRGRWTVTRGVYQGGLQFDARTWDRYAPAFGYPADAQLATREQQIAVAEKVLAEQGARAWPTCGPRVGLTGVGTAGSRVPVAGPPDEVDDDLGSG